MPETRGVVLPDGTRVQVPANATEQQILEFAQSRMKPTDSTFEKMSVSQKAKAHQSDPAAEARYQGAMADAQKDIDTHSHRAAEAVAMIPAVLAAPLTGGASVPAAMAIMGGAGAVGAVLKNTELKDLGASDAPTTTKAWLVSIGVDAATMAAGEGAMRGVVALGKTALKGMLANTAAKSFEGLNKVKNLMAEARGRLYPLVSHIGVDTEGVFADMKSELTKLPRMTGETGKSATPLTAKAGEWIDAIDKDLQMGPLGPLKQQSLGAMIRAKGNIAQIAREAGDVNWEEGHGAFMRAANRLDAIIDTAMKKAPEEAQALYKEANYLNRAVNKNAGMVKAATAAVERMFKGASVAGGAGAGAYYGYRRGGVGGAVSGGVGGAIVGAAGAAGMSAVEDAVPKAALFLLQKAVGNGATRRLVGAALDKISGGAVVSMYHNRQAIAGAADLLHQAFKKNDGGQVVDAIKETIKEATTGQ